MLQPGGGMCEGLELQGSMVLSWSKQSSAGAGLCSGYVREWLEIGLQGGYEVMRSLTYGIWSSS